MNAPVLHHGQIRPDEARAIVETVRRLSGLSVSETKTDFLQHRINRLLRDTQASCIDEILQQVRHTPNGRAATHLVEALTTHTTSFFRERMHYTWLEEQGLPALHAQGAGRDHPLVIWSAACSSGPELWSAGMVVDSFARARDRTLRWELVGTDVSRRILTQAAEALFQADDIQPIPEELRRRHLLRSRDQMGGRTVFRIAPELRSRARLAQANLLDLPPSLAFTADVAFLRNVLIYFEPQDQLRAARNVAQRIRPGGFLITGHSESLASPPPGMTLISPSIYRKS